MGIEENRGDGMGKFGITKRRILLVEVGIEKSEILYIKLFNQRVLNVELVICYLNMYFGE